MKYILIAVVAMLCAMIAYITLNQERAKKVRMLYIGSDKGEISSKSLSKKTIYGIVIIIFILSLVVSYWIFLHTEGPLNFVKLEIALICLTGAACNDYREHRIPNVFSLIMALSGIVCLLIGWFTGQTGAVSYVVSSLLATVGVALCMSLASFLTGQGIGLGDIKLLCALAIMAGVYMICGTLFFGIISCGVLGIALMLLKKKTIKDSLPFGPFIYVGYLISVFLLIY